MSLVAKIKSPFIAAGRFLQDVWFELKRVVWPSKEEAQSFTVVVLIAIAIVAVWVGSLDLVCTWLVGLFNLYGKG